MRGARRQTWLCRRLVVRATPTAVTTARPGRDLPRYAEWVSESLYIIGRGYRHITHCRSLPGVIARGYIRA